MEYVKGWGKMKSATEVEVTALDGSVSVLSTKNTIIATGSEVTPLPGLTIDEERCAALDPVTHAPAPTALPPRMSDHPVKASGRYFPSFNSFDNNLQKRSL